MIRKTISITFLIAFLGWVAWYVAQHASEFIAIRYVATADIIALVIAFLIIVTGNGYFFFVVTAAFRIHLRSPEWLSLSVASSFANYFLPFRGGAGIRAIYLSKVHRLPFVEFVSTLSVMYLMHIVANGSLAIVGMALIATDGGADHPTLLAFFLAVTLVGITLMYCNLELKGDCRPFPLSHLASLLNAVRRIRENRALIFRLWGLVAILNIASIWQCAVAFKAASVNISWSGILVYAASKNLGALISVTPGSLGVVELISIYLGNVLGYGTADALLIQGLIRTIAIAVLLLFGPLTLLYLKRRLIMAVS